MLYLVVHHRRDPNQPWKGNAWLTNDDNRLEAIETTNNVADECAEAMRAGELVRFHRCAYAGANPVVCSEARVASVQRIDRNTSIVRFEDQLALEEPPERLPPRGTNSYTA